MPGVLGRRRLLSGLRGPRTARCEAARSAPVSRARGACGRADDRRARRRSPIHPVPRGGGTTMSQPDYALGEYDTEAADEMLDALVEADSEDYSERRRGRSRSRTPERRPGT